MTDIVAVLHFYGADRVPEGGWRKMRCPFKDRHANGDANASGSVNTHRGLYHCFACGIKGDALGVIMRYERLNFEDAINRLAEVTGEGRRELRDSTSWLSGGDLSGESWDRTRGRGPFSSWLRRHSREGA